MLDIISAIIAVTDNDSISERSSATIENDIEVVTNPSHNAELLRQWREEDSENKSMNSSKIFRNVAQAFTS